MHWHLPSVLQEQCLCEPIAPQQPCPELPAQPCPKLPTQSCPDLPIQPCPNCPCSTAPTALTAPSLSKGSGTHHAGRPKRATSAAKAYLTAPVPDAKASHEQKALGGLLRDNAYTPQTFLKKTPSLLAQSQWSCRRARLTMPALPAEGRAQESQADSASTASRGQGAGEPG